MPDLINGVPREQYGLWCRHGHRLMVPDPTDTSDYPRTIPAEPWPCADGCTQEWLAAEFEAEQGAYEQERWDEYRASQ